ncbi:MAG: acyl-CoA dehydrogenase [Planctomycetota bacterium]|nr:acyl-CoA dehydrogenase [Planctomycetota bacterium]
MHYLLLLGLVFLFIALLYQGHALLSWVLPLGIGFLYCKITGSWGTGAAGLFAIYALCVTIFGIRPIRRIVLSKNILPAMAGIFPKMSETERVALEAGTVWWDADLFSGRPDFKKLIDFKVSEPSSIERSFLENECEELCRMLNAWQIHNDRDLPKSVWDFIKSKGFMGLIIPTEYGGKGFSAQAVSEIIAKISSRSISASVTIMVPNSLGPAELLLHYGTKEQRDLYLPRLADGREVPAFALTEPNAGSDAGSMTSQGVVCKGEWEGEEVLGMRLTWNKRYITLAPRATLLGLAFKLRDPDGLLGDKPELGITCALVPTDVPGVVNDRQHDPLGIPFFNGPTSGEDIFVPLSFIIGGPEQAGQGWRMLMDCLSAGRGVSLPGLSGGGAQAVVRGVGAYTSIREQFGIPIGQFEGIQEPLTRIGGLTYVINAARKLTAGAVDAGEKPAVISAIVKAYLTEAMRDVVNDAMDITGGAGICLGPRNTLGSAYHGMPISITVEGANILTRSMIIFGQGAIRCHPYAFEEMSATWERDVKRFDRALFGHVGSIFTNITRASLLGATCARLATPPLPGPTAPHFRQLTRMSAAFNVCSEISMATLGGSLKFRERITGRLADALSWMYLSSATLKQFIDDGQNERDRPFMEWGCIHAHHEIQRALMELLDNLPASMLGKVMKMKLFPFWSRVLPPSDRLGSKLAKALLDDGEARRHLSQGIHIPGPEDLGLGRLEAALDAAVAARAPRKKVKDAQRAGKLPRGAELSVLDEAVQHGLLSEIERDLVIKASISRDEAVQVDDFPSPAPLN